MLKITRAVKVDGCPPPTAAVRRHSLQRVCVAMTSTQHADVTSVWLEVDSIYCSDMWKYWLTVADEREPESVHAAGTGKQKQKFAQ